MLRKYYKNNTSSTHRPTQMVATCQILSAKPKSMWQTSLLKLNNHFWKVRVKWINYLPCFTKTACDGDKFSFSRLLSDGEFQLTDPRSAKILDEVVEDPKIRILDTYKLQKNIFLQKSLKKICTLL